MATLPIASKSFRNDSVPQFTPVSFALSFIKEMRNDRHTKNYPSLRTAISIPKFLSARYFRCEKLDPSDYLEAAVYNTPYEDQPLAKKIAYRLLFPETVVKKAKEEKKQKPKQKSEKVEDDISGLDIVLSELTDIGIDNLSEEIEDDVIKLMLEKEMEAWEYTNDLMEARNPYNQAIFGLLKELANDFSLVEHSISDDTSALEFLEEKLKLQAGTWSSKSIGFAHELSMSETLQRHSQMPWELASAMALNKNPEYTNYLNDSFQNLSPKTIGKILKYLIHNKVALSPEDIKLAFSRATTLGEHLDLLRALGNYYLPAQEVFDKSILDIKQGLDDAESMAHEFLSSQNPIQNDISDKLYSLWKKQNLNPSIPQTLDSTYDDNLGTWTKLLMKAVKKAIQGKSASQLVDIAKSLQAFNSPRMSLEMKKAKHKISEKVADAVVDNANSKDSLLANLVELSQLRVLPNLQKAIEKGGQFGIPEERIQEFYNNPLEVLKSNIENNVTDLSRYNPLIPKLSKINIEDMHSMMAIATRSENRVAMSTLAAIDMGAAYSVSKTMRMPDGTDTGEFLTDAINKSAGGGENLIKQWFIHRFSVPPHIRDRLKAMIKDVLIEIAKDWSNKFMGNTEEGVVPISLSRPFKPSDDFDNLDVESTLEIILSNGKRIRTINSDDMMIHEVKKGRTAFCILIDISGSMSGENLAICAIAVCMILLKMNPEEVAIALFESDTHIIKEFDKESDLDVVVDELLELKARGGTRVDAALTWARREMEKNYESQVKILYLLSDFYFSESQEEISKHCDELVQQEVRVLATSHGPFKSHLKDIMIEKTDGQGMELTSFKDLPAIIAETINSIN